MPYDLTIAVQKASMSGFSMTRSPIEQVYQKLKMLLMTSPGERIHHPEMGIGLRRFLLLGQTGGADDHHDAYSEITAAVLDQTRIYMPYIVIEDIRYGVNPDMPNAVAMRITITIPSLGEEDEIDIWATDGGVRMQGRDFKFKGDYGPAPPDDEVLTADQAMTRLKNKLIGHL